MPLLLKDATKFALRGQKRQRAEDGKGTVIYPVFINDDSYDFQLVPSGSTDVRVVMDPLPIGEGRYAMTLGISDELYKELVKIEAGVVELLGEKHPGLIWKSTLHPAEEYSATLKVKFYDDVKVYDEFGNESKAPKSWRNVRIVPILSVKAWVGESGAGLWWNILAVKLSKAEPRSYTFV